MSNTKLPALTDEQINAIWTAKDHHLHKSVLSPFGMDRIRAIKADRERQVGEAVARKVTAFMEDGRGVFLDFDDGTREFYEVDVTHEIEDDCPLPIASLPAPQAVQADTYEECANLCDEVKAKSRNHLFRSGADICAGTIRAAAPSPDGKAEQAEARDCTCHPDDNPPVPCAKKYALNECLATKPTASNAGEREAFLPDDTPRRRMANALFAAWVKAEPNHSITNHPESYKASFLDMADAALASKPPAGEQKP